MSEQHTQGRCLDPVQHRRSLFAPIVDGAMYCVIRAAQALMEDDARPAKPLKAKPLPDLESREASSWFSGWWTGIAVGSVIGTGLTVVLFTSGAMA